jgi:hypothetical protein
MSKFRWFVVGVYSAASVCILTTAFGCGAPEAPTIDPAAQQKAETETKDAMNAASKLQKPAKGARR